MYEGEWMSAGRFGTLALPLRAGNRVVACLNIVFSKTAVSTAEAASRYLAELRETARRIERQFSRLSRTGSAR
jgi:IclR family transcriptional regulator, mhp operon transcriptional activator